MRDNNTNPRRRPQLVPKPEPEVFWHERPRIEPGCYSAYVRSAKLYRDAGFKRWTALLMFDVLHRDGLRVMARLPMWLNLGSGPNPKAGLRSRYFQEWVKANGRPPSRGDRLSPKVFTRRMAQVEVGDVCGAGAYSVIRQILSWETGSTINKSPNQGRHE